jgi:hypothetical protein
VLDAKAAARRQQRGEGVRHRFSIHAKARLHVVEVDARERGEASVYEPVGQSAMARHLRFFAGSDDHVELLEQVSERR